MIRIKLNPYIWASIILFSITFIIVFFPVANYFLSKYVRFKHIIEKGSYFIYYGLLPWTEEFQNITCMYCYRLYIENVGENAFLLNITVYLIEIKDEGGMRFSTKSYPSFPFEADSIRILFSETINTAWGNSSLLKFIMPMEEGFEINGLRIDPNEFKILPLYDFDFLGFPKCYTRRFSQPSLEIDLEYIMLDEIYLIRFMRIIPFHNNSCWTFLSDQFTSVDVFTKDLLKRGANINMGFLILYDGNTVPREQNWFDAIWYIFGFMVFPIPIVLMAVAVISLILGIRRGL